MTIKLSNDRGEQDTARFREREVACRRQAVRLVFFSESAFDARTFSEWATAERRGTDICAFLEPWCKGQSVWLPSDLEEKMRIATAVARGLMLAEAESARAKAEGERDRALERAVELEAELARVKVTE